MGKLQLVLKGFWYRQIEQGTKKVEYRDNTDFWRKRILTDAAYKFYDSHCIINSLSLPSSSLKHSVVVLHNGYTTETMIFRISEVKMNDEQIEIHLGARLTETDLEMT